MLVTMSMQVQAWALLEQDNGNSGKARELLEQGSKMDPWHVPIWQAWGVLEFRAGNIETARALFQEVRPASGDWHTEDAELHAELHVVHQDLSVVCKNPLNFHRMAVLMTCLFVAANKVTQDKYTHSAVIDL